VDVLRKAGELDRMRTEAEKRERAGRKTLATDGARVAAGKVAEQIATATGASARTVERVLAEAAEADAAADNAGADGLVGRLTFLARWICGRQAVGCGR
jgi:hypothetical protein